MTERTRGRDSELRRRLSAAAGPLRRWPPWSWALLTAASIALAFGLTASELRRQQRLRAQAVTAALADRTATALERLLDDRVRLIEQLAVALSHHERFEPEQFEVLASFLYRSFPGYQAINWVEPTGRIVYVVPRPGNELALGRDLYANPQAAPHLREAARTGELRVTPPLTLYQGGMGVACYAPVRHEGKLLGFVNGAFRIDRVVQTATRHRSGEPWHLSLLWRDRPVHGHLPRSPLTARRPVRVGAHTLSLAFAPADASPLGPASTPDAPLLVLGMGLSLAVGLGTFVLLRTRDWHRIERSERRHRALLAALPDVVLRIERDSGRVTDAWIPPRWDAFALDQPIGRPLSELLPSPILRTVRTLLATPGPDGAAAERVVELPSAQGRRRAVRLRVAPGGEAEVQLLLRDVTAEREAERERTELLRQRQRSQRLESLGRMASGVAHDFNNLLATLVGHVGLARRRLPAEHPARASLERAEEAALRAGRLTDQLLSFSGARPASMSRLDLVALVRESQPLLRRQLPQGVVFEFALPESPIAIDGDREPLCQVLYELGANAIEALHGQPGRVRLAVAIRRLDRQALRAERLEAGLQPGTYAELLVTDEGVGIEADALERLFDPFYSTKFTGRGLGLAAVSGIVRSHRGGIAVESVPGQGTSFRLWLPIADGRARAEQQVPARADDDGEPAPVSGTVLFVDDDPAVRKVLEAVLTDAGYRVHAATSGAEALALCARADVAFDLALIDLSMPEVSGARVLETLQRHRPEVAAIMMSGFREKRLHTEVAGLSFEGFLPKPFTPEQLLDAVRDALQRRRHRS